MLTGFVNNPYAINKNTFSLKGIFAGMGIPAIF